MPEDLDLECFLADQESKKMKNAKVQFVRDHVEIDFENKSFRIEILKNGGLIINKQSYGEESSQIFIGAKCSNEIEVK